MKRFVRCGVMGAALLALPAGARAIDAKTAFNKLGFPSDTEQQALAGQFVEVALGTSSERDLNVGIAFLVKQPPEKLARTVMKEMLLERVDPDTIAYARFDGEGALAQLAGLKLTPTQLEAYAHAQPGDDLNLSSEEIAALHAAGKDAGTVQNNSPRTAAGTLSAYRAKGLAGMAPYARKGSQTDPAGDLAKDDHLAREGNLLPAELYDLLDNYPRGAPSGLAENFYWSQFKAHGVDTIALVHTFEGTFEGTLVSVQRHYYVSTGYNTEQAIAGFLPAEGGTLVIYTNHTSTDQVAGFGGGAKRSVGRKIMASELKKLFDKTRAAVTR